jgi:SAM-dependent methyltransferase
MKEATLFDMFNMHTGRQIDKWRHYFPIYEKHFENYRYRRPRVLEIGIDHGGSLQLWKQYFGPGAQIIGVDIRPETMFFTEPQIQTYTHDQCDPAIADLGPFDIVIDDGSHVMQHMQASFDNLWPVTTGVYLIEDAHYGFPNVSVHDAIGYNYVDVLVLERRKRMIRGTPSRPLRADEELARTMHGPSLD